MHRTSLYPFVRLPINVISCVCVHMGSPGYLLDMQGCAYMLAKYVMLANNIVAKTQSIFQNFQLLPLVLNLFTESNILLFYYWYEPHLLFGIGYYFSTKLTLLQSSANT